MAWSSVMSKFKVSAAKWQKSLVQIERRGAHPPCSLLTAVRHPAVPLRFTPVPCLPCCAAAIDPGALWTLTRSLCDVIKPTSTLPSWLQSIDGQPAVGAPAPREHREQLSLTRGRARALDLTGESGLAEQDGPHECPGRASRHLHPPGAHAQLAGRPSIHAGRHASAYDHLAGPTRLAHRPGGRVRIGERRTPAERHGAAAGSECPTLGSAPARPLCLLSARLAAAGSSALPE